jgi:osmoprotectant transport system substrate-binding protein
MHTISPRRAASPAPRRRTAAVGIAAVACLAVAACSSSGSSTASSSSSANPLAPKATGAVVVGSANFPEDELLAQIYVDALQGKGVKVTPKFNIGAREVYYPEIEKGAITIIPEYNGALLTTSVDPTSTAASTEEVNAALKAKLPSSLEILNSSSAEDKDSITVTQATATKYHLASISDLSPYAKDFVIGGPSEFQTRADGIPGPRRSTG